MVEAVVTFSRPSAVDGLEAVSVWVADEGTVVVRCVLGPLAGLAVVGVARRGHGSPPRVHRIARARDQSHMEIACHRPIITRGRDRQVFPLEEVRASVRLPITELCERELVAAAGGLEVGDADGDVVEDVQHGLDSGSVILENGVIRTLDASLPVVRSLAIAGDRVAGGVGTHETALPGPERVDLGGRCVLPGLNDAHVHFPTWSVARREVRLEGTRSLDEAVARVAEVVPSVPGGRWLRGFSWR